MRAFLAAVMLLAAGCEIQVKTNHHPSPGSLVAPVCEQVTVRIDVGERWGSGVCVEYRGEVVVLTANHVVDGQQSILAGWFDGSEWQTEPLSIIRQSGELDLAILKPTNRVFVSKISFSGHLPKVGDEVYHLGACYGEISFTEGIVSNASVDIDGHSHLQLNGIASPGSSGGDVFDKNGELLAMVSRARPGEFCWAVPASVIKAWMEAD